MKKMYLKLFSAGILSVFSLAAMAQKKESAAAIFGRTVDLEVVQAAGGVLKCGSTEYEMYLKERNPQRSSNQEFEEWLAPKIERYKQRQLNREVMGVNEVITIPVVVHVIHNSKPYGVDENITDEQILSQLQVLNQDFRRMAGTPGFNDNAVGADIEIEFCLAQRTPNGEITNGINRVSMAPPPGTGWFMDSVDALVKPATIWNPDDYLNIWVVDEMNLFDIFMLAGYAQFPTNSGLQGLDEGSGVAAETDGVVVAHAYFGSAAIYPDGTYANSEIGGRTTVHEIGHWLGLRHIWGDSDSCSEDDYCEDTPPATAQNQVCQPNFSCGSYNMIENYMDYTPDSCMNIFTIDQKARMRTVMENATRRNSLLSSLACTPPPTYGFDAEIKIVTLNVADCSSGILPEISLKNLGTTENLTSAVLSYEVQGETTATYNWSGNLTPGQQATISLGAIVAASGNHQFNVSLTEINGESTDDFAYNNSRTETFKISPSYTTSQVTLTLVTDNYGSETIWVLTSGDQALYQGMNYGDNQTITQTFNLPNNACYNFTIFDSFGDGICCFAGNGSYALTTAEGQTIVSGGEFGISESTIFVLGTLTDDTVDSLSGITLYPNPTDGILNISVANAMELPENMVIYNTLGQVVRTQKISNQADLSVDVSSLTNGVYIIRINKENQTKTLRFIKQ